MPTHSLDLWQRIVVAYQAGGTSIREVAKWFMVTKRTVHRLVQQYKQIQDLTPKKVGSAIFVMLKKESQGFLGG